MTLLSLFMTSTGIFCFVPISQRLIESGIVTTSNDWWSRGLPGVVTPVSCDGKKDRLLFLLTNDKAEDTWSDAHVPLYATGSRDTLSVNHHPSTPCMGKWHPTTVSLGEGSSAHSPVPSFFEGEYTSFTSDTTLCDSCDMLLRHEIPPDHIPSVIRALALFESQDRLCDIIYEEYEMAALTDAFSMLRL